MKCGLIGLGNIGRHFAHHLLDAGHNLVVHDRAAEAHDPLGILDATTRFYQIIFNASGHLIAWDIVSRLNSRISRLRVMTLSTPGRSREGPAQIRAIYEAIAQGHWQAAGKACRSHVAAAAAIAQTLLADADAAGSS